MLSTAILLAASTVMSQGGENPKPGPDYEQLRAMEWMIGDWEAEYLVPSQGSGLDGFTPGAKVHSTCSYFWMENKNYIGLKFRDEIDGKVAHKGFEIIGVDPQSRKTIHWLFSILGGWGPGEWTVEGNTWTLKWSGTTADGSKYEGVSFMVPVDANTHTWEMKQCKENGQPTPDTPLVTYRRMGVSKTEGGDHYLAFWQRYFEGEWTTKEITGDEAAQLRAGAEGTWSCHLAPAKSCMFYSGTIEGQPFNSAVGGYDPRSKAWKEVAFLADGGHITLLYRAKPSELSGEPGGKVIKGTYEQIRPDGRIETGAMRVDIADVNKFQFSQTNRHIAQQKLEDLSVLFERKKR